MNDVMNDEFLYLIANPMKKKKTYVYENIDEGILLLLQKKYKQYHIDEDIYEELCVIINEQLNIRKIETLVKKMVQEIFDNVLSEYT